MKNKDLIFQLSTIQGLAAGDCAGTMTVSELMTHGDTGLGTFNDANGEMTVLDGVCFQALGDGRNVIADADETVPFASVMFFDCDKKESYSGKSFDEFKASTMELINEMGCNSFYVGRLEGSFTWMKVRSEIKQNKPYKRLDKFLSESQRVFEYSDVNGWLVCMYVPEYASGINVTGWHCHFISQDKTLGGHVLDFHMTEGNLELDKKDSIMMKLPDTEVFNKMKLGIQNDVVDFVEKGK
ncbi:MAG: acetolactate decarboxylase [Parasporobacterium sp.]|nr:acetolactate decarboxylase [Parasporobacterium sp.]